jgi:GNAT superfamily N-acetyltransferase
MHDIRVMTAADVPAGMRLKEQNGWNQLEADWLRLLALEPDGCFVAELDGVVAGTACTCVFEEVAWVAMVLVDSRLRGRGLGTALMVHALTYLDGRGIRSIRLDATPLGRPIYERLGFVAEYSLARYEGVLPGAEPAEAVVSMSEGTGQRERLFQWDHSLTATQRRKLLQRLFDERPEAVRIIKHGGEVAGYLTARPGSRAWQIGPCIATPQAGPLLFQDAAHRLAGQCGFIDIPVANSRACAAAEGLGLTVQRHLLRMGRGIPVRENLECLWATSGPEKG